MFDDDLMWGTGERFPADGAAAAPVGVRHAVTDQTDEALCGAHSPFKWGWWPPHGGEHCQVCAEEVHLEYATRPDW